MKILITIFLVFSFLTASAEDLSKIKWVTNNSEPVFASPNAKIGGTYDDYISSFPLTFRLLGPNSASSFANWNRKYCIDFGLVSLHPNTLKFIPQLATHWAIMPDQKTVYYKLDPDVRWSDGKQVTADDYIFAYEMSISKHIIDPYANKYVSERIERVEKIDDYTIKIVGRKPSWRALIEYNFSPMPKHAIKLDKDWVKRANWDIPICVGSHRISNYEFGKGVTFERVKDWWGDKKKYLKGRFNFEKIHLQVIRNPELAFEIFKNRGLTVFSVMTSSDWETKMDFDAVKKGWVIKKKFYNKTPSGLYGIFMNLTVPILKDKNIRKALQHLLDFKTINEKLMYNAYKRKASIADGTEYADLSLKPYEFNPNKAAEYLKKSGWIKRGADGILTKDGQRLSLSLIYDTPGIEKHLSVFKQELTKAGIELNLQRLDGATAYKYASDRNYQMMIMAFTAGIHPSPWQFFHSKFASEKKNNNFCVFANPEADRLIDIYEFDLDENKRKDAIHKLDLLIKDEAVIIPFWRANYYRVLYWNELGLIDKFDVVTSSSFNDNDTAWFDPQKEQLLNDSMSKNKSIDVDKIVEIDPYGVK